MSEKSPPERMREMAEVAAELGEAAASVQSIYDKLNASIREAWPYSLSIAGVLKPPTEVNV